MRYGILDLLKIFSLLQLRHHQLWICGDGDGKEQVEAASCENIKYFGQVSHDQVLELQHLAIVLVNPRQPFDEFTKF